MIDIKVKADEIRKAYAERILQKKTNILIIGQQGDGKTQLVETCPGPILIDSFDPGGTETIRDMIEEEGKILCNPEYENDNPKRPFVFKKWFDATAKLERDKFFESIGTYVIDSGTRWAESLLNKIVADDGRAGQNPQIQDYGEQNNTARDCLETLAKLPCNFVMTFHYIVDRDKDKGSFAELVVTRRLRYRIPALFGESWIIRTKGTGDTVEHYLQTKNLGIHKAQTRIGRKGNFNLQEPADIRALLKKAGRPWEDKPAI